MPDVSGNNDGLGRGQALARISTALVQLHARHYGRGPTKAKTHMSGDMIVSLLQGGVTPVERTLVDTGQLETVNRMRRSFELAMADEFKLIVEEAIGRRVIAHMSTVHFDPDLATEVFILDPSPIDRAVEEAADEGRDGDGGPPDAI